MAPDGEQKPSGDPEYKVYRSRRGLLSRFRAPDLAGLRDRARRSGDGEERRAPAPVSGEREGWDWRRVLKWVAVAAGVWILISVAAFAISAQLQSMKLADSAEAPLGGNPLLLASPQNILVIGTDARTPGTKEPGAETRERCLEQGAEGAIPSGGCSGFRADTLMVVRGGGAKFRKLSIPRDAFTEVEGIGASKINAAYAFGGAGLQVRTVEQFLGIDIDHVVIIDFGGFEDLIDALGGVEVDVPQKLCAEISGGAGGGQGGITLRVGKGVQTMDGQKALAYARVRNVVPCPGKGTSAFASGYDDIDRARAQQQVLNGIKGRILSPFRLPYNFVKGPIIGWSAPRAFVSDMGALTMPQLVLSTAVASSDEEVLCKEDGSACGPGPFGSLEVPESERRRAVNQLLG